MVFFCDAMLFIQFETKALIIELGTQTSGFLLRNVILQRNSSFFVFFFSSPSGSLCLRLPRWPVPIHITPMPPQTQEVPADPVWRCEWAPSRQPTSLPSECQGLPDCHGPCPEDSEEAGQLLQRHHLQQQAHRAVRASPPQGILFCQGGSLDLLRV